MQLYETPSGLGGVFTVRIVREMPEIGDDSVQVRVHSPGNPDWHGYEFVTVRANLKPEPEQLDLL